MDRFPPPADGLVPGNPADAPLDVIAVPAVAEPSPSRSRRRLDLALAALAWLVLVGLVGSIIYRNSARPPADPAGAQDSAWLVNVESQGRYLVGAARLGEMLNKSNPAAGNQLSKKELAKTARTMNKGSYSQRLRYAILVGELEGPTEAREALGKLELDRQSGTVTAREISVEVVRLLDRLYKGYEKDPKNPAVVLTPEEQAKLREGLRWYGDLALAPEGIASGRDAVMTPAVRTAVAYLVVVAAVLFALVTGFGLLIAAGALVTTGKIRSGLGGGSGRGGVYAEAFALYMLLYFGASMALRLTRVDLGSSALLVSFAVAFFSLAALAWPVLRGVPWRQVREDVGLHFGGRPILNLFFGGLTYLAAVPLVGLAIAFMFLMMRLLKMDPTQPGGGPSHPIVGVALQKDWWVWVQVFLVAVVAAPVVEEIMFRGVLYRHLRETSRSAGVLVSVAASVLISGFIFAVIHPQGWLGVPVLMALATVFALAREWRGSLVPSMTAHAINNGLTLLLLLVVAG